MDAAPRTAPRGPSWPVTLVVALMIALSTLASFKLPTEAGTRAIDDGAIACGVVGALAILLWRRSPVAMLVITAGATFAYTALDYPGGPALLPGPVMLAVLGYAAPKRTAWIGALALIAANVIGRRIGDEPLGVAELLVAGWSVAAVLGGQAVRARTDRVAAERERRAQEERDAITHERLRIAQDLHDSVAHAMATINVQAGVAAHLLDRRPEQARDALEAIRAASADVLDELGTILGVLREPGEQAPRTPTGRLEDVALLVDRAERDGLPIDLSMPTGASSALTGIPPSVSTAAYRVVQEALTNVRRHAPAGASASVRIDVGGGIGGDPATGALVVEVTDDGAATADRTLARAPTAAPAAVVMAGSTVPRAVAGRGPNAVGPADGDGAVGGGGAVRDGAVGGFGLIGMRERVESSGGELVAGPGPAGGFVVRASWDRVVR